MAIMIIMSLRPHLLHNHRIRCEGRSLWPRLVMTSNRELLHRHNYMKSIWEIKQYLIKTEIKADLHRFCES